MSEPAKKRGWLKGILVGVLGIGGGAAATYVTTVVNTIAKPPLPVANFAVAADGLTVTCQNHATGESGWWDFGDGTSLEPFAADRPAVPHAYAKPGTYTVKLTVRNFFGDENERAVPVEAGGAGGPPSALPQIAAFAVRPVTPASVAPATFRVTAEVRNAAHCVWDFGDGRLEVAGGGVIDRLVTFDKPGAFPVQLVAHNGTAAAKQAVPVRVDAAVAGTLMAVLKVTDTGAKVERTTRAETVAVAAPKDKTGPVFTKAVAARPGFALVAAAPITPTVAGVKNLRVEVSADRRSANVSGEWAGDAKAGKPGSSDLLVPLTLTEERTTAFRSPPETITGAFAQGADGRISLTLPLPRSPGGVTGGQRAMALEIRQTAATGPARTVGAVPNLKLPATVGTIDLGSGGLTGRHPVPIHGRLEGDAVVLVLGY